MRRYRGFGLILFAALTLIGCRNSKPEPSQPPAAQPAKGVPPVAENSHDAPAADAAAPVPTNEPPGTDTLPPESNPAKPNPSALKAIGRAVAGALGVSGEGDKDLDEAPAYRPHK